MNTEEAKSKLNAYLEGSFLSCKSVDRIKYDPHPYMIGARHVAWASDHWGGMLSKEAIRDGERKGKCHCYQKGCIVPYDFHTVEYGIFFQLKRNATNQEFVDLFENGLRELILSLGLDKFVMVETEEKFRIN